MRGQQSVEENGHDLVRHIPGVFPRWICPDFIFEKLQVSLFYASRI